MILRGKKSEEFLRDYVLGAVNMHPFLEAVVIEAYITENKYDSIMASQRMEADTALSLIPGKVK